MKRTFRKFRAVIRRSSLTKGLITFFLTGAGILSFLVMAGESDPDTMTTAEVLIVKAYAAVVMIIDIYKTQLDAIKVISSTDLNTAKGMLAIGCVEEENVC